MSVWMYACVECLRVRVCVCECVCSSGEYASVLALLQAHTCLFLYSKLQERWLAFTCAVTRLFTSHCLSMQKQVACGYVDNVVTDLWGSSIIEYLFGMWANAVSESDRLTLQEKYDFKQRESLRKHALMRMRQLYYSSLSDKHNSPLSDKHNSTIHGKRGR